MRLAIALAGTLVCILAIAGAGWKGYRMGAGAVQARWDVERAELASEHNAEIARLERVKQKVVVQYLPKVEYVRGETITLTKEVPVYVTTEDDAACAIPPAFERLHDYALGADGLSADRAAGRVDGAAGPAPAAEIVLSTVGRAVVGNYGACRDNALKVEALQAYVRGIAAR